MFVCLVTGMQGPHGAPGEPGVQGLPGPAGRCNPEDCYYKVSQSQSRTTGKWTPILDIF